jgi:hypothetical protein
MGPKVPACPRGSGASPAPEGSSFEALLPVLQLSLFSPPPRPSSALGLTVADERLLIRAA